MSMFGDIGAMVGSVNAKLAAVASGVPGAAAQTMAGILKGAVEKQNTAAAFSAILLGAVEKANHSTHFSLEAAINDLNVKLGNLRGAGLPSAAPSPPADPGVSGSIQQAMQAIQKQLDSARNAQMQIAKHMP